MRPPGPGGCWRALSLRSASSGRSPRRGDALERILGHAVGWAPLEFLIGRYAPAGMERAAYVAAGLSASLEMARDGRLELRQERPFAALLVRARPERDLLG